MFPLLWSSFWLLFVLGFFFLFLECVVSEQRRCAYIQMLFLLLWYVSSAEDLSSPSVLIPHPLSSAQHKLWVGLVKHV